MIYACDCNTMLQQVDYGASPSFPNPTNILETLGFHLTASDPYLKNGSSLHGEPSNDDDDKSDV